MAALRAPIALAAVFVALPAVAREKTDVLVLVNGDRLHGEIKGMSRGKLEFGTDDAGTLSIEWVKVARATSTHSYEFELSSGEKHFGPLLAADGDASGLLRIDDSTTLPIVDVVGIVPLDAAFFSRVKAYLDVGFTLAKSNRATTFTTDGEVTYRGDRFGSRFGFNSYVQDDENTTAVSRNTVLLSGDYYFTRWRASILGGAESNDELDLELRLTGGGGAAYPLVHSNSMELWTTGGLVVTREKYGGSDPSVNVEGYFNGTWDAFRYDTPKLDLGLSLAVFPSLSDFGRVRGELGARVKYELFRDFNVGLGLSSTFDSRPPDPAAAKTDYVATFTVGWSWRR